MHQMTYYNLILRYPGLRQYINQCHLHNRVTELLDFLFALDTDEDPKYA
jgi:hypothetical protein